MTRINIVEVSQLTNAHCLAEYKEITRPFNKVIKRIEKYGEAYALKDVTISKMYILGTGQESFFFSKLFWLYERYYALHIELFGRGYNLDVDQFLQIRNDLYNNLSNTIYWKDYHPTPEEIYLNMARLCKRSNVESVLNELTEE